LLYEGPDAIRKIRTVLGSTDPSKAEPGTVRSDFGRDLMRNGAHASDSPENALRERRIVGLGRVGRA
ncbi:MAG: nucleoside-diphosphate kinase, partial [Planctomycetes bacterium]|nr:nucleoside-diphosphate kinase [Planctomycetota bacterium]